MDKLNSYVLALDDETKKIQLKASLITLKQVDLVIEFHNEHKLVSDAEIIINIFGLLQSLFVAVDALYNLALTITNSKSYININQNKSLNNLKHIRNDIVGHPISRRYGEDGIGYSIIENENLKPSTFTYYTYLKKGSEITKNQKDIDLNFLKHEYLKEKSIIIKRLDDFLEGKLSQVSLSNDLLNFYYNSSYQNYLKLKNLYTENYGNLENTRFVWRLDLLDVLLNDKTLDDTIREYLIKLQTIKLLEITNDLEEVKVHIPYLKLPAKLVKIYKYFNKNPEYVNYLKNLHDPNNPYFNSDLNYLIENITNIVVKELLLEIKNTSDEAIVYLIGSIFKNYKSK